MKCRLSRAIVPAKTTRMRCSRSIVERSLVPHSPSWISRAHAFPANAEISSALQALCAFSYCVVVGLLYAAREVQPDNPCGRSASSFCAPSSFPAAHFRRIRSYPNRKQHSIPNCWVAGKVPRTPITQLSREPERTATRSNMWIATEWSGDLMPVSGGWERGWYWMSRRPHRGRKRLRRKAT